MARPPREDYPGAIHHVINRGARREVVFTDPGVYILFLEVLQQTVARYDIGVLAYALMPNHWHLLVRSRHGNLSEAMQFMKSEFGRRLNAMNDWDGPIWNGRFFNKVIEGTDYLRYLYFYLMNNPVKAGLCPEPDAAEWTSHRYHLGRATPPDWLQSNVDHLFAGPEGYERFIRDCAAGNIEEPDAWQPEQFERPHRTGRLPVRPVPRDEQLDRAVGDLAECLGIPLSRLAETRRGPVGNPAGCVAAWWLVESTVASNAQAARRLGISPKALAKRARRARRLRNTSPAVATWMNMLEAKNEGPDLGTSIIAHKRRRGNTDPR